MKKTKEKNYDILEKYFKNNYNLVYKYSIKSFLIEKDINYIKEILIFLNEKNGINEVIEKLKIYIKYHFSISDIYENNIILFFLLQESETLEEIILENFKRYNGGETTSTKEKLNYFFYRSIINLSDIQYKIIKNIFYIIKINYKSNENTLFTNPSAENVKYTKNLFERYNNIDVNSSLLETTKNLQNPDEIIYKLKSFSNKFFKNLTMIPIYNFVIYGSYSLHLLNKNIKFNDIDIYCSNPIFFMRIFSLISKWIFDVDLSIVIVPLVKNYVTIKYKGINIFDIIYINKTDLDNTLITTTKINNNKILNYIIQFFNLIHYFPDPHRILKFIMKDNYDNNILKISLLLEKSLNEMNIKLNNIKNISIKIPILKKVDNYIVIKSEDFLINKDNKKNLEFNNIIFINSIDEDEFIGLFEGIQTYYKVFKGIYNEITILAKDKLKRKIRSKVSYVNGEMMFIKEENKKDNILTNLINAHLPCLLITNNTARIFYENDTNNIVPYSIETLLCKILLSLYFMKYNKDIIHEYFIYLLKLITVNKCDFINNSENIKIINKFKTSSKNHKVFTQTKNYLQNFTYQFENTQTKTAYSSLNEFKIGV